VGLSVAGNRMARQNYRLPRFFKVITGLPACWLLDEGQDIIRAVKRKAVDGRHAYNYQIKSSKAKLFKVD